MALCMSLSSCSKDDEGNTGNDDIVGVDSTENNSNVNFFEITINGKTYKESKLGFFSYTSYSNSSLYLTNLFQEENSDFFCDIFLVLSKTKNNFEASLTGNHKLLGTYSWNTEEKNLDLIVRFDKFFGGDHFELLPSSTYNVTEVKLIETTANDKSIYSVSGNFSCQHKNPKTEKVFSSTGKFKYILTI